MGRASVGSRVLSLTGSSEGGGPLFGVNDPRNRFVSDDLHPVEDDHVGTTVFLFLFGNDVVPFEST